nr:hypothetical protein [Tanacetum cinerariifolium]
MPLGSPPHQSPPPPPPTGPSGTSRSPEAFGSSQVPPPPPSPPTTSQEDDDMALDAQVHSSDDEDIGNAHIPNVNLRQDWWKQLKEDRPATPEPAWSIPSSDVPISKNNWASALASTYSPPPEDSLLAQTGDMAMFMDWFCKRQRMTELKPQDLEGPAFELVKVFHPNDATGFEYKHDYTVIESSRAVTFWDKYEVQMIMRFNEIHKFSDSTLHRIDEALDYRVKEFKVNRTNLGLNTRFWTRKDMDRSKEFMFAIQKRLKTLRIFRNLKSFVGGRVRDGDYRLRKRTE